MNSYWKYLIVVAAAGTMAVGCDRDKNIDYQASGPGYEINYEVKRGETVNQPEERATESEMVERPAGYAPGETAEEQMIFRERTEMRTEEIGPDEFEADEGFDTEFDDTPGAMADRGTDTGQVEEREPVERRRADRRQAPMAEDLAADRQPAEQPARTGELAQTEEPDDIVQWEEPADQWAETDQPDDVDPMTEDEWEAATPDTYDDEIAIGEPEPATDIDIDDKPTKIEDEEDEFVFDRTPDDGRDNIMMEDPRRMGIGFMVGGGVNDYVNDFSRPTSTGGNWDVRAIFGTQSVLAGELAYHGTANGIDVLGMDNGAVLMSNGAEGALRVNFLTESIQPYVLGGIGWKHFSIENTDTNTSNVANNDNAMTVPVGAGLAYKFGDAYADVRGMYRPSFLSNMVQDGSEDSANLDTISGSLNLGFHF